MMTWDWVRCAWIRFRSIWSISGSPMSSSWWWKITSNHMRLSIAMGIPPNGWFIRFYKGNVHWFGMIKWGTPILGNPHIHRYKDAWKKHSTTKGYLGTWLVTSWAPPKTVPIIHGHWKGENTKLSIMFENIWYKSSSIEIYHWINTHETHDHHLY